MREPAFWWHKPGMAASLLAPLSSAYGLVAGNRLARRGWRAAVPVICIGDPTVGGAGKTPTALAVAQMLLAASEQPAFLSRGYGGTQAGPLRVDSARRCEDVGDEPLLLARVAPTIVARNRVDGAMMAVGSGASVIIMDDGFQNASLAKDFSVLVVDAGRGIGNGSVIPAGPLRAPLAAQLRRADALVVVGTGSGAADVAATACSHGIPVFAARLEPNAGFAAAFGGSRALAFAGIGNPDKFFATLAATGVAIAATRSFPDHHRFAPAQAQALCDEAERDGLVLVTTEKDLARLAGDEEMAKLVARVRALPVALAFEQGESFRSLLLAKLAAARTTRKK